MQRYLAGGSLKESRLGLLFNAAVKVPLQFFILLLGAIVFMFYQFEKPPVYFNQPAYQRAMENGYAPQLAALKTQFDDVFTQKRAAIRAVSSASPNGSSNERDVAMTKLRELDGQARELRNQTKAILQQAGADPKSSPAMPDTAIEKSKTGILILMFASDGSIVPTGGMTPVMATMIRSANRMPSAPPRTASIKLSVRN